MPFRNNYIVIILKDKHMQMLLVHFKKFLICGKHTETALPVNWL